MLEFRATGYDRGTIMCRDLLPSRRPPVRSLCSTQRRGKTPCPLSRSRRFPRRVITRIPLKRSPSDKSLRQRSGTMWSRFSVASSSRGCVRMRESRSNPIQT